ncbi:hypothetical protein FOZ62_012834, partial [Perkinsus olseni]
RRFTCDMPSSVLRAASIRYDVVRALRRGKKRRRTTRQPGEVDVSVSSGPEEHVDGDERGSRRAEQQQRRFMDGPGDTENSSSSSCSTAQPEQHDDGRVPTTVLSVQGKSLREEL